MPGSKVPNKRRLVLRIITLASSLLVLVLLIAASPVSLFYCSVGFNIKRNTFRAVPLVLTNHGPSPSHSKVSHSSSPFSTPAGLAFHYVVAILSTLASFAFVFNYFNRRLRRQEKMKRYILFGIDIVMTLAWMIDIFICITKFPCAVGGQNGWCDMYNTSVFLGIVALLSFLGAFIWDIWGSFDHSKLIGDRPLIRKAPPGWDKKSLATQGAGPGYGGARYPGMTPGSMPGAFPGATPGQAGGAGAAAPPAKKSKALW